MEMIKLAAAFLVSALLAGCPRETPITVHNHTGAEIEIVSTSGSVAIAKGGHSTIVDFHFDRDTLGAQALKIRGSFGERCHQLMFAGLNLSDEDLGIHETSGTLLVVENSGSVKLIPSSPATSLGSISVDESRAGSILPICDSPIRK